MPNHLLLVQQCDYIYQNKILQVYIRTSSFVSFETTTLVCWPIIQHTVHSAGSLLCSDVILQHLMTSFFMDLNDLHILLWILKS